MRSARRREAFRLKPRRVSPVDLLLVVSLIAAVWYTAKPLAEDLHATAMADEVISSMSSNVDRTNEDARKKALAQAQAYNFSLSPDEGRTNNQGMAGSNCGEEDILDLLDNTEGTNHIPYEEQLRWDEQVAMCWIEIPRIAVREPVYHGTSDETLAMGVGHLSWSSLPVGGISSHCVLAAHSGMEESRMFDNLDRLKKGDVFVVHTLADAYQYEVYQVETVLPHDAEKSCRIVAGEDLCTLITCTPYGINTHRLLVHARRMPYAYQHAGEDGVMPVSLRTNDLLADRRTAPVTMLALGTFGLMAMWAIREVVLATKRFAQHLYKNLYGILLGKEARH